MPAPSIAIPPISQSAPLPLSQYDIPLDSIRPVRMLTALRVLGITVPASPAEGIETELLTEHLPISEALQWIFEAINALGTAAGRDELVKWLHETGVDPYETHPTDENQVEETPQELVIRIALMAREIPAAKDALQQAMLRCEVSKHRATCCYVATDPRPIEWDMAIHGPAIKAAVLAELSHQRIIPYVECQAYSEPGGVPVLTVTHGEPNRAFTYLTTAGKKTIRVPPMTVDVIRYAPTTGVISFCCRQAAMIRSYLAILGRALFDDEHYFSDHPLFNLARLLKEEAVREAAERIPHLRSAKVTTMQVRDDEEGGVITIRHPKGVFRQLRKLNRRLIVLNASITLTFIGENGDKDDRVVVRLRPPHGLSGLETTRREPVVNQFLEYLGLYEAESQERNPKNWQAFEPWIMTQTTLQKITGGLDQAPLFKQRIIIPFSRPLLDVPIAGPGLVEVVKVGGRSVAIPPDRVTPLQHPTPTDQSLVCCDLVQQAKVLGQVLGCEGRLGETCCDERVIECGWKEVAPGKRIYVFLLRSQLREEDGIIIRKRSEGGVPVGLVPDVASGSSIVDHITVVPISLPAVTFDGLLIRLARAVGFASDISGLALAKPSTQFVFDEVTKAVHWYPTMTKLEFEEDQMLFLWNLARAYPEFASHGDLAGGAEAAKKVKRRLVVSFEKVIGPEPGKLIKSHSGLGYSLQAEIVRRPRAAA